MNYNSHEFCEGESRVKKWDMIYWIVVTNHKPGEQGISRIFKCLMKYYNSESIVYKINNHSIGCGRLFFECFASEILFSSLRKM